jgi:dsRNA-specific ribonuclease
MNNVKNKLITKDIILGIISKYTGSITIGKISTYQKAFVQKSFCVKDDGNSDSDNYSVIPEWVIPEGFSNERMEFLGDKVIDLITAEFLYDKYPNEDQGFLTKIKSRLVKKESLSKLGNYLGFKELILINSNVERISGRDNPRFLEDIFESFIAALYKDQNSDLKLVSKFLIGVYTEFIDFENLINSNDNYKDSLLQYFHRMKLNHPVYTVIPGTQIPREFTVILVLPKDACVINEKILQKQSEYLKVLSTDNTQADIIIGLGVSTTKKQAEQLCSKDCLINLNVPLNFNN